jgi:hypothetical protein
VGRLHELDTVLPRRAAALSCLFDPPSNELHCSQMLSPSNRVDPAFVHLQRILNLKSFVFTDDYYFSSAVRSLARFALWPPFCRTLFNTASGEGHGPFSWTPCARDRHLKSAEHLLLGSGVGGRPSPLGRALAHRIRVMGGCGIWVRWETHSYLG